MRILLIEDDERLTTTLAASLRLEGFAVDVAPTAEDGRWMATEIPYDSIILDVGLPDGDGIDLCAALRDGGVWAPILVLTAHAEIDQREALAVCAKRIDCADPPGQPALTAGVSPAWGDLCVRGAERDEDHLGVRFAPVARHPPCTSRQQNQAEETEDDRVELTQHLIQVLRADRSRGSRPSSPATSYLTTRRSAGSR